MFLPFSIAGNIDAFTPRGVSLSAEKSNTALDEQGQGTLSPGSGRLSSGSGLLQHPRRSLRALLRLSRRRHAFALAVLAGSLSTAATLTVLGGAATVATIHHFHTARHEPLAPAKPAPSSAVAMASVHLPRPHHRFLSSLLPANPFHENPLRGLASWYGSVLQGHHTASGETFEESELTAAHRTLPFGTMVRVTDLSTSRSVVVKINDRGALAPERVIDLSAGAAGELGILRSGLAKVKLEVLRRPATE